MKFDNLQLCEKLTSNDEYENFVHVHMEAVTECIPTKPRDKHRVPWKIVAVREKLENVKTASLCNKKKPTKANLRHKITK